MGTVVQETVKSEEYKNMLKKHNDQQEDEWNNWDTWMRQQWEKSPTPWYEVPDAAGGDFHYINKNTYEVIWTPPQMELTTNHFLPAR